MTAATLPLGPVTSRVPLSWARWSVRRPGAVLAASVMLALVAQPALLPHLWWAQAVVGGLAAAQAYGLAVLTRKLRDAGRRLRAPRPSPGAAAGAVVEGAARGPGEARPLGDVVRSAAGPMALFVAGGGVLAAYPGQLAVAERTGMPGPPLADQALALAGGALVALALIGLVRAAWRARHRVAVAALAPALVLVTAAGAPDPAPAAVGHQAVGSTTTVGPEVGAKGREFLTGAGAGGTRVYVGLEAGDSKERARLAVEELERVGGLEKGTLLIDVPTGSGWVNPKAVRSLERLTRGDVATVAVQYAASPSWWAYLKGGGGVQQSVRDLVDAVNERPGSRRVLIYGESLGAWGGLRAYPKGDNLLSHVDGALWAGVPGGAPRTGTSVIHPDDPVPAWSPQLMWRKSDQWPRRWLPVVSFWQATADVISAPATPTGFGHRYGDEVTQAWKHLLAGSPTYDSPL